MIDYISEIAGTSLPFPPVAMPKLKRVFDIFVTLLLLLLSLPVVFIIVVIYLLENLLFPKNHGPLFYIETRISAGRPFRIYKFRIFKSKAEKKYYQEHGFVQTKALEQEPGNLTFLGKILKKFYLDELPQLLNVLKGDMTLVGPRPSNEVVTREDGQKGKFQRYLFRAGITGAFQTVKDRPDHRDQTELDMRYIIFCRDNPGWRVVLTDINILWQTCFTILRAKGI